MLSRCCPSGRPPGAFRCWPVPYRQSIQFHASGIPFAVQNIARLTTRPIGSHSHPIGATPPCCSSSTLPSPSLPLTCPTTTSSSISSPLALDFEKRISTLEESLKHAISLLGQWTQMLSDLHTNSSTPPPSTTCSAAQSSSSSSIPLLPTSSTAQTSSAPSIPPPPARPCCDGLYHYDLDRDAQRIAEVSQRLINEGKKAKVKNDKKCKKDKKRATTTVDPEAAVNAIIDVFHGAMGFCPPT